MLFFFTLRLFVGEIEGDVGKSNFEYRLLGVSCFPRKPEVLESTEPNRYRKAQLIEGFFFYFFTGSKRRGNDGNLIFVYSLSGTFCTTKQIVDGYF